MAQPRFIFPFEPLLEHRRRLEKDQMRAVAVIQQQANALITQIQDAQQAIRNENRQLTTQHLTGKLDMAFIAAEKRYVGSLNMVIAGAYQRLAIVERQLGSAKALLLAAAKARKIIERLREKQYNRWLADVNRKEAEFLDELGTQLALRKMLEEQSALAS